MKTVKWRKSFKKDYKVLNSAQKKAWAKAYRLFIENDFGIKLRRHKLKGKYEGLESIDISHDLRALFIELEDKIIFYYLKNHNQLYS